MLITMRAAALGVVLFVLSSAAPAVAEPTDLERARQLLVDAEQAASRSRDEDRRTEGLMAIARAQARAGDGQRALATAARLGAGGLGTVALQGVVEGFAEGGDVDAALATAARIRLTSDDTKWFGRFGPLFAVLFRAMPRDLAVLEVAARCAERGNQAGAARAAGEIGTASLRAAAYAALAEAQARAGDRPGAEASFRRAVWGAEQARLTLFMGTTERIFAYRAIGRARGKIGDREEAVRAFDTAVAAGRSLKGDERDDHIAEIAVDRAASGDLEGASRTLGLLHLPHPEVRAALARGQAEAGQDEAAVATATAIHDDIGRLRAFIELGQGYVARGDRVRARQAFERAVEAAEQRSADPRTLFWSRDHALLEVMRAQALAGDGEGARETSARVSRGSTRDSYVRDALVKALAEGQARANDFEAALGTVAALKGHPAGASVWRAIGSAAGRQGAAEAVLARGPAEGRTSDRAMFLVGLAEGLMGLATSGPPQP